MTALRKPLRQPAVEPATREELIRRTTALLRTSEIFDVRADLKGYAAPSRVFWQRTGEGHLPDVTGGRYVIQVETAASLELEHTRARCELFSAFTREHRYSFVVVVPEGYKRRMEWQLAQWSIAATVWQV
jgi:hypothetical protein